MYEKYNRYKDSGVEWLGDIPEHWEIKKTTHLFNEIGSGTTPTSGNNKYYDGSYSFLQTGDLNDGYITKTNRTVTELAFKDFTSLRLYPKDSLVMAMYGATIGKLGILSIQSSTNQACCVFGKSEKVKVDFFFFLLLAFRRNIISMAYGGGQPNISQDLIKSLRFPIPPLTEQTAIANFLDKKTSLIDDAIELEKKTIALLKEQKQILIQELVTGKRVWDKTQNCWTKPAEVKDSGVEWIGEIPKDWEVKKTSHLFSKIGSGTTPSSGNTKYYGGKYNFLQTGDLTDGDIYKTNRTVTELALRTHSSLKLYPVGSLVMAMYGATIGKLGILQIESTTNQACCVFEIDKNISNRYFFYVLRAFKEDIISQSYGGGQPNISQELIRSLRLPIAPLEMQDDIVYHIEQESAKIDRAIALQEQKIEKLKELKATLIDSAVTGKIKVSEV